MSNLDLSFQCDADVQQWVLRYANLSCGRMSKVKPIFDAGTLRQSCCTVCMRTFTVCELITDPEFASYSDHLLTSHNEVSTSMDGVLVEYF